MAIDGLHLKFHFEQPTNINKRPKLIKIGFYSSKLVATIGVEYMPVTIWKMRNNEATSSKFQAQDASREIQLHTITSHLNSCFEGEI